MCSSVFYTSICIMFKVAKTCWPKLGTSAVLTMISCGHPHATSEHWFAMCFTPEDPSREDLSTHSASQHTNMYCHGRARLGYDPLHRPSPVGDIGGERSKTRGRR